MERGGFLRIVVVLCSFAVITDQGYSIAFKFFDDSVSGPMTDYFRYQSRHPLAEGPIKTGESPVRTGPKGYSLALASGFSLFVPSFCFSPP